MTFRTVWRLLAIGIFAMSFGVLAARGQSTTGTLRGNVTDETGGSLPGATVTESEIIDHCREKLAVYKAPAQVAFVKELPKSATGKILKRMLRQQE